MLNDDKLMYFTNPVQEGLTTFEEYNICITDKEGKIHDYKPMTLAEIVVGWFEIAKEKNWDYKDYAGSLIANSQLDEYIRRLENAKK